MSAGTKIVQLRDALRALLKYAHHRRDCLKNAGNLRCTCGYDSVEVDAVHLSGADPGKTGRPTPEEFARRSTPRRYE